jgi:hypothetical protein
MRDKSVGTRGGIGISGMNKGRRGKRRSKNVPPTITKSAIVSVMVLLILILGCCSKESRLGYKQGSGLGHPSYINN